MLSSISHFLALAELWASASFSRSFSYFSWASPLRGGVGCGALVLRLLGAVIPQVQLSLQQVGVDGVVLVVGEVGLLHVVVVLVRPPRDGRGVGGGGGSGPAATASASTVRLTAHRSGRGFLHLGELLDELVQLALGAEAEAVDRVGSDVAPLAELLAGLGEGHVRRDGRVDDGLGALDRDDPVESPGGVVEEGDGHRGVRGRDPGTLRLGVDVENVRLACEDRLLT